MRRIVIAGVAGLAFAAAGYVGFNAWLAWGLPARPVRDYEPVKGCEDREQHGNFYIGSPHQCEILQQEAALFKANPGLGVRDGDNLTIFYRGRQTHRLVPAAGKISDCDAVEVHKAIALFDPASGRKEQVALISCHRGEFEDRFVALPDGGRWTVHDATASPDGRMIATGSNWWMDGTGLDLYAWPSRRPVAHFKPARRVIRWRDEMHVDVTCFADRSKQAASFFDARAWRGKDGVWRMQATRWLDGRWDFNDYGDLEMAPGFSLWPLPRFTATGGPGGHESAGGV